jgi:L-aspartate oxidase
MKNQYDVLILGSGVAGLVSALKLAEKKHTVAIVTREVDPKISNSYWAQGGIIYSKLGKDNPQELAHDIMKASSNTSSDQAINLLISKSAEIVEEVLLRKVQTDFSRDEDGELKFTKEAAHSRERIIYKGDFTGKEIQISLLNYLNDKNVFPNVTFLTGHTAIDLITPSHHGVDIRQRYDGDKVLELTYSIKPPAKF